MCDKRTSYAVNLTTSVCFRGKIMQYFGLVRAVYTNTHTHTHMHTHTHAHTHLG